MSYHSFDLPWGLDIQHPVAVGSKIWEPVTLEYCPTENIASWRLGVGQAWKPGGLEARGMMLSMGMCMSYGRDEDLKAVPQAGVWASSADMCLAFTSGAIVFV